MKGEGMFRAALERHPKVLQYDAEGTDPGYFMLVLAKGWAFDDAAAPGEDPEARMACHSHSFPSVKEALARIKWADPLCMWEVCRMIKFISGNGDSRQSLVDDRMAVVHKLREARKLLAQTVPHGRNYIGDDEGYHADRAVWSDRAIHLEEMIMIIETEAEAIFNLPGRP